MDALGDMTEPMLARALAEELGLPLETPGTPSMPDYVQQCVTAKADPVATLQRALDRVTRKNADDQ